MLILAAVLIATVAGFAQSVSGFGFALLSVPLLIPWVGAPAAVVAATGLGFLLSVGTGIHQRAHIPWRTVFLVSGTALVGLPVGLLALRLLDARWLSLLIGCVVIGMTVLIARPRTRPIRGPAIGVAGAVSGALLTSTGMNGPPLVLALQGLGLSPRAFRAGLQTAFALQDIAAIVGFTVVGRISADALTVIAAGVPGLAIGWLVGDRVFSRIDPKTFRRVVLGLLAATGTFAIVQAIIG